MKKNALLLLMLFISTASRSQANQSDDAPARAMLKTFYTAYMSAFSDADGKNFENVLSGLRKKYCTAKCEKQFKKLVAETDGDPIIHGQDSDAKWAKTLVITRNANKPNVYQVQYSNDEYGEDGKLHKVTTAIKLMLINENGSFKIDAIL